MVLVKRGLGRGLEALLVEMPGVVDTSLHSYGMEGLQQDNQHAPFVVAELPYVQESPENRQTLRGVLLKEAEALKNFLDDFETMLQRHSL